MHDPMVIPRPEPLKQRITSNNAGGGSGGSGGRRRPFFSGHARRKRRGTSPQEPLEDRLMPSIHEEEEGWSTMSSRLPNMHHLGHGAMDYGYGRGMRLPRGRRGRLLAVACCALAAVSCLSVGNTSSALGLVGRQLSALGGRLLSLVSCDPSPYITAEQARDMPPTPLPGAELAKAQEDADGRKEEYVPSHIAMCQELHRRHDLSYGDAEAEDPDAVAARFPPFVVNEHEGVCSNWEAPHFHLMEMLASTFLGVYGDKYNVAYRPDCSRTRGEYHASHGSVATQRDRNLQYRTIPQLGADEAHLLERARLEYDTTTVQQILADISLLLDRAKTSGDAEREVLALCRGCIQQHEVLKKTGVYDAPAAEEMDGVQQDVADEKAKEYNLKMSHVSHECLLYPGGKSGEAAKQSGNGVALSALRPIVVTLIRHAALDWKKRSQAPADEGHKGAVVYMDDESGMMPAKVYADRIPQSVKTVSVLVGPLCGRRPACLNKANELVGFLSQLYPSADVQADIVASTAAAFSRMVLSKHLIAPPGTVTALLPALAKPTGTFGAVGESEGYGTSTSHWFGDPGTSVGEDGKPTPGPDDGAKVGLAWCVTPDCKDAEDDEDDGAKVGLTWGLPGEEDDQAKVGLAWGLPGDDEGEEDDRAKVNMQWGLPGSNLDQIELTDEEVETAEEEGYVLTPEETEELEEKWDRPVELKPEEYWAPPKDEPEEEPEKPKPFDMSVSHSGTEEKVTEIPGNPGKSTTVYTPGSTQVVGGGGGGRPPRPGQPRPPTTVYQTGGYAGYATGHGHGNVVASCTHVQGRLGRWAKAPGGPGGQSTVWKSSYPQCAMNLISVDGLCNVVHSLGLGRVMFVGDKLQGSMVRSMHNMLGLGDVDPNALAQAQKGVWSKNVHCPRQGRSFELTFAHNDRIASQTVARVPNGAPQYVQGGVANGCVNCAPWVPAYVASPVRTFLVACPCAACAPEAPHNHGRLRNLLSRRQGKRGRNQERELAPAEVRSDVDRFLQVVRDAGRPDDAVFVRTAAPTYCKGGPHPDEAVLGEYNDRVHDAVYESEWGRTHRGAPGSARRRASRMSLKEIVAVKQAKEAEEGGNPKSPNPKAADQAKGPTNQARRAEEAMYSPSAPAYLLDVAPMTSSHPDSEIDGGVDCEDSNNHGQHVMDWWNHLLYTSMIDLARKEDPNFKLEP